MSTNLKILVVGGGFVGITLAAKLLKTENVSVTVLESSKIKLKLFDLNYFEVNEPGLSEILVNSRSTNKLRFLNELSREKFNAVFICVGTTHSINDSESMNRLIDLSCEISTCLLENGFLFIRSTVQIGTTDLINKWIHELGDSNVKVFFAPERTAEGVAMEELDTLPQILAASNDLNFNEAKNFLEVFGFQIVKSSSYRSAEFVKLISNAWRDTIFAISNDIAEIAHFLKLDIYEILSVVGYNYPRAKIPKPGPVGGPCLSKDTHILFESLPTSIKESSIVANSRIKNENLYLKAFQTVEDRLRLNASIKNLIFLGLSFKGTPKTNDIRESFATKVIDLSQKLLPKIGIQIWDPSISDLDFRQYLKYKVEILETSTPKIIVIGNDGHIFNSPQVLSFFNQMNNESFIVDFWGVTNKFDLNREKIYLFGRGN